VTEGAYPGEIDEVFPYGLTPAQVERILASLRR